jgi:hypothetical protein
MTLVAANTRRRLCNLVDSGLPMVMNACRSASCSAETVQQRTVNDAKIVTFFTSTGINRPSRQVVSGADSTSRRPRAKALTAKCGDLLSEISPRGGVQLNVRFFNRSAQVQAGKFILNSVEIRNQGFQGCVSAGHPIRANEENY